MKTTTIHAAIAAALAIAAGAMTVQADTYYWKTGGMFYTDAWTNAVGSAITVANSATYVDHDFVVNPGQDISSVAYADENNTECKFNTKSLQLHGLMWCRGKYLEYCKFRLFGGCELRCCGRRATGYPAYINANSSIYVEPSATRGTPAKITTRYDAGRSQKGTELQCPISGSGALCFYYNDTSRMTPIKLNADNSGFTGVMKIQGANASYRQNIRVESTNGGNGTNGHGLGGDPASFEPYGLELQHAMISILLDTVTTTNRGLYVSEDSVMSIGGGSTLTINGAFAFASSSKTLTKSSPGTLKLTGGLQSGATGGKIAVSEGDLELTVARVANGAVTGVVALNQLSGTVDNILLKIAGDGSALDAGSYTVFSTTQALPSGIENHVAFDTGACTLPNGAHATFGVEGNDIVMTVSGGNYSVNVENIYPLDSITIPSSAVTEITGAGGMRLSSLAVPADAKFVLDPIATPISVSATPTFGAGAKIALSAGYAGMTLGRVVLLTWTGNSIDATGLFDTSSVSGPAAVACETAPDGTSKQLVLTVGDYDSDAKEIRIVPIGDSITQGYISGSSLTDYPQYRTAIAARLAANGYKPMMKGVWRISQNDAAGVQQPDDWRWHCGVRGDRIITVNAQAGVRDNVHVYLDTAGGKPDVVTLLIGTNDLHGDPAATVYDNYTNLIWQIAAESPGTKIVGATVLDRTDNSDRRARGNQFNGWLRADYAAHLLPADFVLLDLYAAVPHNSVNFGDSVHLNWAGCALASDAFAGKIMETLPLATYAGPIDDMLTDVAQTATGAANIAELDAYRSGMTHVFTIDAAASNAFATAGFAPYTTTNAVLSSARPLAKAGYYMELVRKGTSRRRWVWVDFDAAGKSLEDIDFPWNGTNMKFFADKLHVRSSDPSIHAIAPDDDGKRGIIEGTWHNYEGTDSLSGAPAELMGSNTAGWDDTLRTGDAGYGCFQAHRVFSQSGTDTHWVGGEVLFAWNKWSSSPSAFDEIGIGTYACHNQLDSYSTFINKSDYTYTANSTYGLEEQVAAGAYQVRHFEIWVEEMHGGVWTGAVDNDLDNPANWSDHVVPNGTTAYIALDAAATLTHAAGGAFAPSTIVFPAGSAPVTIGGSALSLPRGYAIVNHSTELPTFNVPVAFAAEIDVTGNVNFAGGVTGTCPTNHTTFTGSYTLTAAEWTPPDGAVIATGSVVRANTVVATSSREYLFQEIDGTLEANEIKGTAVFYIVNVANAATQPVVKVNGLVCENKSGVTAGYILLAGKTGGGTVTYIVGADGLTVTDDGATTRGGYYYFGGPIEIYPTADFSFGLGGYDHSAVGDRIIAYCPSSTLTVHTSDYETQEGRIITVDGAVQGMHDHTLNIDGSGMFVINTYVHHAGTMNVSGTATVAINAGKQLLYYDGQGRRVTMGAGTTLMAAESGTATMGARAFTLNADAALAFNFTEKNVAPVLSMPSATANYSGMVLPATVNVKISASNGVTPRHGTYTLTSGSAFKFTGKAIRLVDPPAWVKSVDVVNGDLVLTVRPMGVTIIVR